MASKEPIRHEGEVVAVEGSVVHVKMTVHSACASCEAHAKCSFSESRDKVVAIPVAKDEHYEVGDHVMVVISRGEGLLAVWWAYLLPAVGLIAVYFVVNHWCNELISACAALGFVGLYWGVLALLRKRLDRQFRFSIEKDI